jgi:flavin-dependent dehydrogenase
VTAVVIGAGMAGLVAARVLSDRYEAVTVLDRDALPKAAPPDELLLNRRLGRRKLVG